MRATAAVEASLNSCESGGDTLHDGIIGHNGVQRAREKALQMRDAGTGMYRGEA